MLLLALDTSTPAVTVALHDGENVLAESTTIDARRHTELLSPAIVEVLGAVGVDRRDLTAIAVGAGPGPFTGLRIGLVTARVLGSVLDRPVHGVCSLDVVARGVAMQGRPFVVVTDARRREVYWAAYDTDGRGTDGPTVAAPEAVATDLPAADAGAQLYPHDFPTRSRLSSRPQPTSRQPSRAVTWRCFLRSRCISGGPTHRRRPGASPSCRGDPAAAAHAAAGRGGAAPTRAGALRRRSALDRRAVPVRAHRCPADPLVRRRRGRRASWPATPA